MNTVKTEHPFRITWVIADCPDTLAEITSHLDISVLVPTEELVTYPFMVNDHGLGMLRAMKRNSNNISGRCLQARADEIWYTTYDDALLEQAAYRRRSIGEWRPSLPRESEPGRMVDNLLCLFPASMRFLVSNIAVCNDGKVVWVKKGETWDFHSTF
jgi:hypothetical protein